MRFWLWLRLAGLRRATLGKLLCRLRGHDECVRYSQRGYIGSVPYGLTWRECLRCGALREDADR